MKLFHWLRVPRNFRALVRARRPFFVVKFHANLFNGSLAIANKRGDELFVERGVYVHACTCVCMSRRDRTFVARARLSLSLSLSLSRSRHAELVSYSSEKYKINIVSDPCVDIFLSLSLSLSLCFCLCLSGYPFAAIIARYWIVMRRIIFSPLLRRETARPAKIPESIFSNIRPTFDICKLYTYEDCACERASERAVNRARDRLAHQFMKENLANKFNATLI